LNHKDINAEQTHKITAANAVPFFQKWVDPSPGCGLVEPTLQLC